MKMFRPKSQKGLTLFELLVSLALMSLIAGALTATLSGGVRVWKRMNCQGVQEQTLILALDQMRHYLQRMLPYEPIPFEGKYNEMSFPVLLDRVNESGLEYQIPGRMGYYIDGYKRLCRGEQDLKSVRQKRMRDVCSELAANVYSLQFKYFVYDRIKEEYVWVSQTTEGVRPVTVKVNVKYYDACGEDKLEQNLSIYVPQGTLG